MYNVRINITFWIKTFIFCSCDSFRELFRKLIGWISKNKTPKIDVFFCTNQKILYFITRSNIFKNFKIDKQIEKQHHSKKTIKMGNTQGKAPQRRNKEERGIVKNNRMKFISLRKKEINDIEDQIQSQAILRIKNSPNDNEGVLVLNEMKAKAELLETTKKQLDREGAPFTKADLIAIIVALDPVKYANHISTLNDNTIADLNTIIRLIIYDPSRYASKATGVKRNIYSVLIN